MKKIAIVLIVGCWSLLADAQSNALPLGSPLNHFLQRMEIKTSWDAPFFTALRGYHRSDVVAFAEQLDGQIPLNPVEQFDIQFIYDANNEYFYFDKDQAVSKYRMSKKPVAGVFYKTPANLLEVNTKDFMLRVNPIFDFALGKSDDESGFLYTNRRGFSFRGSIDQKVFFQSDVIETQQRFPNYVDTFYMRTNAIPGAALVKPFESSSLDFENGKDFLYAEASFNFAASRHIGIEMGHGRHFIGDGFRSLIMSDFSEPYFYLKLNTKVWKFQYQNLFIEAAAKTPQDINGDRLVPKKYLATHYLTINAGKNLNFGLVETVVFSRENGFELQYLNPIIFYRTVEAGLGSPDNASIGFTWKWNFLQRFSLYGQFFLDDINLGEIFDNNIGFWGNRFGVQAGIKYIDAFGIDNLDLQFETNHVRPYTYAHKDSTTSYAHTNQAIAHPLGANFREYIFTALYRPIPRLALNAKLISATSGEDAPDENYGANILVPNGTRSLSEGVEIGQGVPTDLAILAFDVDYQLKHNLYLTLSYFRRDFDSDNDANDLFTQYLTAGIRLNLWRQDLFF